jgi:Cytochrome C'
MRNQICLLLLLLLVSSCRSTSSAPAPTTTATTEAAPARKSPADRLDELDARQAVPLLPMMAQHQKQNMREHLTVVQEVVAALGAGDFAQVARASKRMGYSETMGQMCEHMGAGAPGFTERALAFHHSADRIAEAAAKHDSAAVLAALAATLATCTTCHATYKQQLVDALPP